jgi:hypothetical protein
MAEGPVTSTEEDGTMRRPWVFVLVALCFLYIGSYLVLSRAGFAYADTVGAKGFWFFEPRDSDLWRVSNYGSVSTYYPLIAIDCWLGTGRPPAAEPLLGLSK